MRVMRDKDGNEEREGTPTELAEYERAMGALRWPAIPTIDLRNPGPSGRQWSTCAHGIGIAGRCEHPITCACKGWGCGSVSTLGSPQSARDLVLEMAGRGLLQDELAARDGVKK